MRWLSTFVAKPQGRTGAVCPFVPPALRISGLWSTVCDRDRSSSKDEMCKTVSECLIVSKFGSVGRRGTSIQGACYDFP